MATGELTDTARTRTSRGALVSVGYALVSYTAFTLVLVYAVAFLADTVVARTVDRGGPHASTASAVVIDALLLGVFAVQHSVMARPGFKARWVRFVPRHVERATYVLASTAALALAFWQWRPIPSVVWHLDGDPARIALWTVYAAGWLWVVAMTFAIDHLDLFGLRQVARHLRRLADDPPTFALPLPYRLCRHPMMLGFLVAFFVTPTMSVGHLLFALLGAAYIVVGVRLEERDLSATLPEYHVYAASTPRLVPWVRPRG